MPSFFWIPSSKALVLPSAWAGSMAVSLGMVFPFWGFMLEEID